MTSASNEAAGFGTPERPAPEGMQVDMEQPGNGKARVRDDQALRLQNELEERKARQRQRLEKEDQSTKRFIPRPSGVPPPGATAAIMPAPGQLVSDANRAMLEAAQDDDALSTLRAEVESIVRGNDGGADREDLFWGLQAVAIEHNPESMPGSTLYKRFIEAFRGQHTAERAVPSTQPAAPRQPQLMLGFHGTPEHNIAPILREGLDANRRRGQAHGPGEYFATHAWRSLPYCRGGKRLLVFAVMVPPLETDAPAGTGIVW